tara:strand:+ start:327 stop:830 length:504 start_codon:yes stop_codon:yes gene_type:complete
MTLEQDLNEASAKYESLQAHHNISLWCIGICVATIFFSFMAIFIEDDEEYVSPYDPAYEEPGTPWQTSVCVASLLFGLLFLGYGMLTEQKMTDAANQVNKIRREISIRDDNTRRKKAQERKRKNKEKKRKSDLEQKERELENAKKLMEEGGIENLNRAIRIFRKYEK